MTETEEEIIDVGMETKEDHLVPSSPASSSLTHSPLGKNHALKKYDQFALNNLTKFNEIFVAIIMNKLIYYYC